MSRTSYSENRKAKHKKSKGENIVEIYTEIIFWPQFLKLRTL